MLTFSLADINPNNAMLAREVLRDMDGVLARIASGAGHGTPDKKAIAADSVPALTDDTDEVAGQTDADKAKLKAASDKARKAADARKAKAEAKEADAKKKADAAAAQPVEVGDYEDQDHDGLMKLSKERGAVFLRTIKELPTDEGKVVDGRGWMAIYFSERKVKGFSGFDETELREFLIAMDEAIIEHQMLND